jgi:hypothetical protein
MTSWISVTIHLLQSCPCYLSLYLESRCGSCNCPTWWMRSISAKMVMFWFAFKHRTTPEVSNLSTINHSRIFYLSTFPDSSLSAARLMIYYSEPWLIQAWLQSSLHRSIQWDSSLEDVVQMWVVDRATGHIYSDSAPQVFTLEKIIK